MIRKLQQERIIIQNKTASGLERHSERAPSAPPVTDGVRGAVAGGPRREVSSSELG